MKKTICELFAGVGGFRLGLEKASKDWETVWFSQWEPGKTKQWAHDCYVQHWGEIDENTGIDIAEVDKTLIPDHNLLVGGFPCQDYSVARPLNGSTGLEGKKGVSLVADSQYFTGKADSVCIAGKCRPLIKISGKSAWQRLWGYVSVSCRFRILCRMACCKCSRIWWSAA